MRSYIYIYSAALFFLKQTLIIISDSDFFLLHDSGFIICLCVCVFDLVNVFILITYRHISNLIVLTRMDHLGRLKTSMKEKISLAEWRYFNSELLNLDCEFLSASHTFFFLTVTVTGCSRLIAGLQSQRTEPWCFYQQTGEWMNFQLCLWASEAMSLLLAVLSHLLIPSSVSPSLCLLPALIETVVTPGRMCLIHPSSLLTPLFVCHRSCETFPLIISELADGGFGV